MNTPFRDTPNSAEFEEDHKAYQAKRLKIWNDRAVLIKQLITEPNGETRVIHVRRLKAEDEKERRPPPAPLEAYQQYSTTGPALPKELALPKE